MIDSIDKLLQFFQKNRFNVILKEKKSGVIKFIL